MHTNKENPSVGEHFKLLTQQLLTEFYGKEFTKEKAVNIGNPPKAHRFDLVSKDESLTVECKCYNWTKGANPPSAKMSTGFMDLTFHRAEK